MICLEISINEYGWNVKVFFDITCNDLYDILLELNNISCPLELIDDAISNFKDCDFNNGCTYSNYSSRQTLIFIGKASSKSLILNTTIHEAYHFISLLSRLNHINDEEKRATLIGDFVMLLDTILSNIISQH